ncbi:MAG TPA: hypothetical protein VN026_18235 [Bacteroidia bacterium]|jgi:hypothetical protein|nr:hypothetical protein [Bacteroidia bacterium]
MTNGLNGIDHVKNGINKGEIIAVSLGIFLFGLTVYAMSMSIKASTLNLKKLSDEGYK